MPPAYAPLPNPRSAGAHDEAADRELEGAFASDDEEAQLLDVHPATPRPAAPPGAYDFERGDADYDYPPPGSPPPFELSRALGNSNGVMGAEPARPRLPRPSFFRRAVGALLPTHYTRIPVEASARVVGGGTNNDGVFANVAAKPSLNVVPVRNADGSVQMVLEDAQRELPPSYAVARLDAVPTYYETTVHAPASFDPAADMIVEDLPTGSVFIFFANVFVSFFFQFVGFLMTYLMHTSHAAKYGSRAGLGLTLIQYGYYSRMSMQGDDAADAAGGGGGMMMMFNETKAWQMAPPGTAGEAFNATAMDEYQQSLAASWVASRAWLSFALMTLGWFLMLTSVLGYWRVKHWELSLRAAAAPPPTPEQVAEVNRVERAWRSFFGHPAREEEPAMGYVDTFDGIPDEELTPDQRLQRNLVAAGFL